jgi:hypothetical protein
MASSEKIQTPQGYVRAPGGGASIPANAVVKADKGGVAVYFYRDRDADRPPPMPEGTHTLGARARERELELLGCVWLPNNEVVEYANLLGQVAADLTSGAAQPGHHWVGPH